MSDNGRELSVDVSGLIDSGGVGRLQIRIVVLCGLVALLDGADSSSIAIAAPTLATRLGVAMSGFGPIFSAGTLGAMIGAMVFGPLADRFGRKRLLLVATGLFGFFTILTAHAEGYEGLAACRLLAGLGLGGATPCFLALASEYVPRRMRGSMVSALWAAFPLGIMIGGFLNSYLVGRFGWQSIFHVGGAVPLLVVPLLALALPESLQVLVGRRADPAAARLILAQVAPGRVPEGARLKAAGARLPGAPAWQLFTEGRALRTLALWVPFFTGFGVLGVVVFFTPALLKAAGVDSAASAGALVNGFNGFGALIGMGLAGRLVDRFNPAAVIGLAFLVGAASLAGLGLFIGSLPLAAAASALVGVFVGIGASGSIALAALLYPASIRATGIGWGMAMGRCGQVVGPLVAARLLGAVEGRGMLLSMVGALVVSVIAVLGLSRRTGGAGRHSLPLAADAPAE